MIKHMYLLFFICGSMSAVKDVPTRDSMTIIFEEHPPKVGHSSRNAMDCLKKSEEVVPDCLDYLVKSPDDKDCDVIDCATGVCIVDGLVKLLACIGIFP